MPSKDFTLGVEEEYQIIDPHTRRLRPRVMQILPLAQATLGENAQPEFQASQIEMATPVCGTLAEVRAQVVSPRAPSMTPWCRLWSRRAASARQQDLLGH